MNTRGNRGVGYCENSKGCEELGKGVFLLNHGTIFCCPRCRYYGKVVEEKGTADGEADQSFKEVQVKFNYDPINEVFRETAIVRDESIFGSGRTYTFSTPLVRTERRALKVAETMLSNLQMDLDWSEDVIPQATEMTLDMSSTLVEFQTQLTFMEDQWKKSSLVE